MMDLIRYLGWQDAAYDRLVERAARTTERSERMAMYRQADRYLVEEKVVALPIPYVRGVLIILIKPWVRNFLVSPLGREFLRNVIVEEH